MAARGRSLPANAGLFGTAEVARILGVSPVKVRGIVRAGLCRPTGKERTFQFSFQDLVLLRTAHGLLRAAVPARRVRSALGALSRQLAPNRPLSGVRIYADGKQVVVRDGHTAWQPDSGQVVFSFDVDDLAKAAGVVIPANRRRKVRTPRKSHSQDALIWFERGLALERRKDDEAASVAYRKALAIDPEMGDAYINLGRLVHQAGNFVDAARLYHLAIECSPDDPVAHYDLALAFEDQEQYAAAVAHYQRAVTIDGDFADAHFNLGRLFERLGQPTKALRHLLVYRKLTDGA